MPNTDGFAVLKGLKNGEINCYKNQPVIAMTGSREHSRDFYLKKGFAEVLKKPFSNEELVSILYQIFPERNHDWEVVKSEKTTQIKTVNSEKYDLSLLKSFLNTPEALEEVLTIFNTQTETDIQLITVAVATANIEKIKEIVHRMLTMFRQLKAIEVIPILEKMEDYEDEVEIEIEIKKDYEALIFNIRALQKALSER
jgi:CheY-like chemotaxis protein